MRRRDIEGRKRKLTIKPGDPMTPSAEGGGTNGVAEPEHPPAGHLSSRCSAVQDFQSHDEMDGVRLPQAMGSPAALNTLFEPHTRPNRLLSRPGWHQWILWRSLIDTAAVALTLGSRPLSASSALPCVVVNALASAWTARKEFKLWKQCRNTKIFTAP